MQVYIVILAIIVLCLVVVMYGLLRQVGVFLRNSADSMVTASSGPEIGSSGKKIFDLLGQEYEVDPQFRYTIVLILSTTCSACVHVADSLRSLANAKLRSRLVEIVHSIENSSGVVKAVSDSGIAYSVVGTFEGLNIEEIPIALVIDDQNRVSGRYIASPTSIISLCENPKRYSVS